MRTELVRAAALAVCVIAAASGCVEAQRSIADATGLVASSRRLLGEVGATAVTTKVVWAAATSERTGSVSGADQTAAEKAARESGVDPRSVPSLYLKTATVSPTSIHPGDQLTLQMDYAVTIPRGDHADNVNVEETWQVMHAEELLATTDAASVSRSAGVWRTRQTLKLPTGLPAGTYTVRHRVATDRVDEKASTSFVVVD